MKYIFKIGVVVTALLVVSYAQFNVDTTNAGVTTMFNKCGSVPTSNLGLCNNTCL